jgi:hypothetical protein
MWCDIHGPKNASTVDHIMWGSGEWRALINPLWGQTGGVPRHLWQGPASGPTRRLALPSARRLAGP